MPGDDAAAGADPAADSSQQQQRCMIKIISIFLSGLGVFHLSFSVSCVVVCLATNIGPVLDAVRAFELGEA